MKGIWYFVMAKMQAFNMAIEHLLCSKIRLFIARALVEFLEKKNMTMPAFAMAKQSTFFRNFKRFQKQA